MTFKKREKTRFSIDLPPSFIDQLELKPGQSRKEAVEDIVMSPRHELTPYELIPLDLIDPNPFQPRKKFDKEKMARLVTSIMANGLINPATGRRLENGRVQLAAGERRLRAFRELNEMRDGFDRLPVIIKEMTNKQMARTAAAENTDREDISPIEKARSILELVASGEAETQQEAGSWYNLAKSATSETVLLLELPLEIVNFIDDYELTQSHGRELRRAANGVTKEQLHLVVELARESIRKKWYVEDLHTKVDEFITAHKTPPPTLPMMKLSPTQVDEAVAQTIAPPAKEPAKRVSSGGGGGSGTQAKSEPPAEPTAPQYFYCPKCHAPTMAPGTHANFRCMHCGAAFHRNELLTTKPELATADLTPAPMPQAPAPPATNWEQQERLKELRATHERLENFIKGADGETVLKVHKLLQQLDEYRNLK